MIDNFELIEPEIPWDTEEWSRASHYTYTVWWSPENEHFLARCVEIPEAISHGITPDNAVHNAIDAVAGFLNVVDSVPPPSQGDGDAIGARHTTKDVAVMLGISVRRVQALARSRDVGVQRGRALLFSDADIDVMRDRRAGRPATF